jgi:acetyl-CoA carboxylase biotin carboxylase subunit
MVANRGEIACRVLHACRALNIPSVAIFSEGDKGAPHVHIADEAICIGPAESTESYLNIKRIIEVALDHGVDAIHPGYGFLAENSEFVQECERIGIKFIGPRSKQMRAMGNKCYARQLAKSKGVPIIPGTENCVNDYKEALTFAKKWSFPVIIKPAAGGGGIGMRVVYDEDQLKDDLKVSRSLSQSAFGDPSVYLEKFIERPRHIEVQIFADEYGKTVHLYERECSIQRRHQKLVEEAPSQQVDTSLRTDICRAAISLAQASGYTNAGTVEFLIDQSANFYFLEMNTRLQVEHGVTEMTTGIDIAQLQIRAAAGEKLPFGQTEIKLKGHAIECRVYAEDPENDFFPSWGQVTKLTLPRGEHIRIDIGFAEGGTIPYYYDPLIAKVIVWGASRTEAMGTMLKALNDFQIEGIITTIPLSIKIIQNGYFQRGEVYTDFLPICLGLP